MHDGIVLVLCRLSARGRDAEEAAFTSKLNFCAWDTEGMLFLEH